MDWVDKKWHIEIPIGLSEIDRLEYIIRELRNKIFDFDIRSYAHERDWEDEGEEERRIKSNEERKIKWDRETERLIYGNW